MIMILLFFVYISKYKSMLYDTTGQDNQELITIVL